MQYNNALTKETACAVSFVMILYLTSPNSLKKHRNIVHLHSLPVPAWMIRYVLQHVCGERRHAEIPDLTGQKQ